MKKFNVAVVGVGAVGEEMLRVLMQRNFPANEIRVFARSDRKIMVDGRSFDVKTTTPESFEDIHFALFAGTEGEKGAAVTFAADAVTAGAVVIDNGADFRMDPKVPLVVPEVNAEDLKKHNGIIANPNCSTIQMVVALTPIHKKFGLKRIIASTYQAVSGSGRSAIVQTEEEYRAWADGRSFDGKQVMDQQVAFNLFPHIGGFRDDGFTSEEMKMVYETHKIMHDKKIKISTTTVRVPVLNGHSEAVYIETREPVSADKVRALLKKSPGIIVVDDPKNKAYPMPRDISGRDETFVGRIRNDQFVKNGMWLWIVADNIRKGAATNAVQIAETMIKMKLVK